MFAGLGNDAESLALPCRHRVNISISFSRDLSSLFARRYQKTQVPLGIPSDSLAETDVLVASSSQPAEARKYTLFLTVARSSGHKGGGDGTRLHNSDERP